MKKIEIYSVGIVCASVCAETGTPIKEITSELNASHPTGIRSKWKLSENNFQDGKSNPCECNEYKNRKHYLFNC